jgi:16S rRNA (guanine527-N7)-methyltransferase
MTPNEASPSPITELPPAAQEQLIALRDLLVQWNRRFNLTACTEPADINARLIGDSLQMLPVLDEVVDPIAARQREPVTLIDVGTGAGFPGLVLKIARPELDVTLLDATGKKIRFVEQAIAELGLTRTRAIHGRAEEIGRQPHHRERYDVVTARAVAALPALLELTLPLLRIGGTALFPKGLEIDEEIAAAAYAAEELGGRVTGDRRLESPLTPVMTRLVVVSKILSTSNRYPRRSGVPAKEPLGRVGR